MITHVWKVLAFVVPLGLDSFAVAAALGTRRPSRIQRWRMSALFVVFEGGMPLLGLALGVPLAHLIGSSAEYVAAAALVATGLWLIVSDDDGEERAARNMLSAVGWTVVALGLSISLDELAIGFTLGLVDVPVLPVVVGLAIQALVGSQLGLALGARIGEAWRERAERLAGLMLIILGIVLAIQRVSS
jgi:putative Mn2+ efflux pump MntP